jgi:hypothetical protein
MADREVDMWQMLEVLRRLGRGESLSTVAAATGRSRKTIRRYRQRALAHGWSAERGEVSEELTAAVWRSVRPRREPAVAGETERRLEAHRDRIREWLTDAGDGRGLRLTKVHEFLAREGVRVPYSSLHRFAIRHCGFCQLSREARPPDYTDSRPLDFARS